jgi:hypothetical protein
MGAASLADCAMAVKKWEHRRTEKGANSLKTKSSPEMQGSTASARRRGAGELGQREDVDEGSSAASGARPRCRAMASTAVSTARPVVAAAAAREESKAGPNGHGR